MNKSSETMQAENAASKMKKNPIIEVKDLSVRFGDITVLNKISLSLYQGENLVILGRSGCGKSVLVKCMVGLLKPARGSIRILEDEITLMDANQLDEKRKKIGFLFQRDALYDSMSVRENLEFPLTRIHKKLTPPETREKVETALENVGLLDAIDKMPSELSGGMRKRVSLARTLVIQPIIILYDEPTTGLDPATTDEICNLINDVREKYRTSSIIITHDIRCAKAVGDRIIVLNNGDIYEEGHFSVLEKSTDPFIKSFFI